MRKTKHTYIPDSPPVLSGESLEDCLLFDIETTGLSAVKSHIYLIGCAYKQKDTWQLCQWFAESSSEEFAVLYAFLQLAKQFARFVTFNGAGFDLPYLKKKCSAYLLDDTPLDKPMTDIYRRLNPYRKWLAMPSLHQKDVERLMGLQREDLYTGGELIGVYRQYRRAPAFEKDALLDVLLLHNLEDVQGMLTCINALLYVQPFEKQYAYADGNADEVRCELHFRLAHPVAAPFTHREASGLVTLDGDVLTLTLPVENGCIRYYYADYQNYVYLPQEKQILPKAMAKAMGGLHTRPATRENCCRLIAVTPALLADAQNAEALCDAYMQWCKICPKANPA